MAVFTPSKKVEGLIKKLTKFMNEHIYPNEEKIIRQHNELPNRYLKIALCDLIRRWSIPPLMEELKEVSTDRFKINSKESKERRTLEPFSSR